MDRERYERMHTLFLQACELAADERARFVAASCEDDPSLHAEVLQMLEHDSEPCSVLAGGEDGAIRQWLVERATDTQDEPLDMPSRIGAYTIVRKIGAGGMGAVYEARQDYPHRTVALKVILPGAASRQLVDRFRREANLLARLQHPGLAHIYEAGIATTSWPGGGEVEQPFLAMELVRGLPLDAHVAQNDLTAFEKLGLLAEICDAVQHAHDRGVIHRDLKPGNILVQPDGRPKVLDFGIARATDADLQTVTLQTGVGQLVGTLAYMSPEQALGDPDRIDARSDVYTLGVLAFELLSGRLPIAIHGTSTPEAVRRIRDDDPTRLSRIDGSYRGDLDTIIQKALEKDPQRRYQSAVDLATDVRRYLSHEPISAHPPSRLYRLKKFTRRHRGLVYGLTGTFAMLLIGIVATSTFAWQAAVQRSEAEREARRVAALNEFLIGDLFQAADPSTGNAKDLLVRDMLQNAAAAIDGKFGQDPDVEALIRTGLGRILLRIGDFDAAEHHLRRAVTLADQQWEPTTPESIEARRELGAALWRNAKIDESQRVLEDLLDTLQSADVADDDLFDVRLQLGHATYHAGDYAEAERRFREIRQHYRETSATTADQADITGAIGNSLLSQGKVTEAIAAYRETLTLMIEAFGDDHAKVGFAEYQLGTALANNRAYEQAEQWLEKALDKQKRFHGAESPDVAETLYQLARMKMRQGELIPAWKLGKQVLAMQKRLLHPDHVDLAKSHDMLSSIARRTKNYDIAEQMAREAHRIYVVVHGPDSRAAAITLGSVGIMLLRQNKLDEAIATHEEALQATIAAFGEDEAMTYLCRTSLGECLTKAGRYDEAEPLLTTAYAFLDQHAHPRTSWARKQLLKLYEAWGRPDRASAYREPQPQEAPR